MSDKKNNYNPKKVRIYDEDLKKILSNTYNINDGKEKFEGKKALYCILIIALLIIVLPFIFNLPFYIKNGFNDFLLIYFENLKEYLYSSLFVSVVALVIFLAYKKKVW